MRLLLASRSVTRRTMLEAAGVAFEAVETEIDETGAKAGLIEAGFEPRDIAEMLAEIKARGVGAPADALVLGADQVLERDDGTMLSKAGSREQAALQLRSLSGRVHFLHSAAVLFGNGERVWGQTETVELAMRPLSETYIQAYLDLEYEAVQGSVGCYRIEGRGAQLFDEIWGSHFAVLGLPLLPLLSFLRERGLIAS
jgi:septum formation protein